MTFKLLKFLNESGDDVYYSDNFRVTIESCLDVLRTRNASRRSVESSTAYKYEGDFYGLLLDMNVDSRYHWVYLRVNGLSNPTQYTMDSASTLVVPDHTFIDNLASHLTTTQR